MESKSLTGFAVILAIFCTAPAVQAQEMASYDMNWAAEIMLKSGESGSGFVAEGYSNQWFVTAKHVLFNPDGTLKSDSGIFHSFSSYGTNNQIRLSIDFQRALVAKSLLSHSTHDVAVCLISTDFDETRVLLSPYAKRMDTSSASIIRPEPGMVGRFHQARVGRQVYMLGFPRSLGLKQLTQLDYEQPLLRGGIVAGTNPNKRTIIIDCASYFGNSGGPVVQIEDGAKGRSQVLIGLVSEYIPLVDIAVGKTHQSVELSNSGYTVVEPMDFVYELIEQYRTNQPTINSFQCAEAHIESMCWTQLPEKL